MALPTMKRAAVRFCPPQLLRHANDNDDEFREYHKRVAFQAYIATEAQPPRFYDATEHEK
jgi:hypothetical protein